MTPSITDALRQPEYTGENRCEPCTALNLLIAAVLGWLVSRRSRLAGFLAVVVSVGLISLRGYLVPGTPTLTKRYLPATVLRWFGKDPEPAVAGGLGAASDGTVPDTHGARSNGETASVDAATDGHVSETADTDASDGESSDADQSGASGPVDLESFLVEHGMLEPCADSEDLCLTDAFESDWFDAVEPFVEGDAEVDVDTVLEAFDIEADEEFELVSQNEGYLLRAGASQSGHWPSRTALVADVAASRVLDSWIDEWETTDLREKGKILNGVRMFLERCPSGGGVRMTEEEVKSCCRPHTVLAVVCEDTGERLFEHSLKNVDR